MRSRLTLLSIGLVGAMLAACTVQLVAPYNSELAQRASSMQAELVAWDLRMRSSAGTPLADPRHPEVAGTLNRWRGEAEAMLTIAISNDPGTVNCSEAVKRVSGAIESRIAAALPGGIPPVAAAAGSAPARGCAVALVAEIDTGIDNIERALKWCRADWIGDAYFTEVSEGRPAPKPPPPPNPAAPERLQRSCSAEFRPPANAPAEAAGARQGRAVSGLATTLQAIVYVENRKRAALSK